jgi:ABC-type branched-subunit amino acid transport system ATPase component
MGGKITNNTNNIEESSYEILTIKDLTSGYSEETIVLKDINMKLREGAIYAVIGPNGAGKSTLLKTIYGILKPKKGKIIFKGINIAGLEPWQIRDMGIVYIPQEQTYFPYLTVEENLELCSHLIRKKTKRDVSEVIGEVLDLFVNLKMKRRLKASYLSGGELKMLDIACGIVIDPKLMLIDEPTAGLAPNLVGAVYNMIKQLQEEKKISILLVDQNILQAVKISEYVYIMEGGRVVFEGYTREILDSLYDLMKKVLIGFS